jgi:uncharacterized coiled-coil DUF342 family protein
MVVGPNRSGSPPECNVYSPDDPPVSLSRAPAQLAAAGAKVAEKEIEDLRIELRNVRRELADALEELATSRENLSIARGQRDALRLHVNRSTQLIAQVPAVQAKLEQRRSLIRRLGAEIRRFLRRIAKLGLGGWK